MKIKIEKYSDKDEAKLQSLFYNSLFEERKEYEYKKEGSWYGRYERCENSIVKIAKSGNTIIGSLGVLPVKVNYKNKILQGGCFVDNCTNPEYNYNRSEILNTLFEEMELELVKRNYDFLWGWDYEKNIKRYESLIEKGYKYKKNVNWISGGFEYKMNKPKKWRAGYYLLLTFILLKFYNKIKKTQWGRNLDFNIRPMHKEDIPKIANLISDCYPEDIIINYDTNTLKTIWNTYNMGGLIAEKNNKIIGAIPFEIAAWSGWMFGRPLLDADWETFYTILPETFAVDKKFIDTEIPTQIASILTQIPEKFKQHKKTDGFVTDVFDQSIKWRRKAYLNAGYLEPDIDLGSIFVKSFNNAIEFNSDSVWHIPPRNIVAPAL